MIIVTALADMFNYESTAELPSVDSCLPDSYPLHTSSFIQAVLYAGCLIVAAQQ